MARICNRYDIQSSDGKRYIVTSHQLRHVGITDRLYAGFRPIDIMSMTHHKSEKMIQNSYLHIDEFKLKEHALSVIGEEKREVLFKGPVIYSTDDKRWEMVLKKPLAHSIGKLGVCSDISDCQCDMYECLNDCPYFAINAENLPYFEEELASWKKKEALYLRLRKTSVLENARHNIILFEKNIKLIKDTLRENEDE